MSEKKMIATREGFGKEIVALGKENPDILVVDIDIGKSCKTGEFRKELPDQYINVGIAEQNGAGVAAGLATCGKIPFVVTYAVLLLGCLFIDKTLPTVDVVILSLVVGASAQQLSRVLMSINRTFPYLACSQRI